MNICNILRNFMHIRKTFAPKATHSYQTLYKLHVRICHTVQFLPYTLRTMSLLSLPFKKLIKIIIALLFVIYYFERLFQRKICNPFNTNNQVFFAENNNTWLKWECNIAFNVICYYSLVDFYYYLI